MKRVVLLSSMLVAGVAAAQGAKDAAPSDFEYHGYMRSGIGFSRGGTDQACFGAEGADAKLRLGNECETYIEAAFSKLTTVGKGANEPRFRTNFRLAAVSAGRRDWEPTNTDLHIDPKGQPVLSQEFVLSLREAYVDAENVFGTARPWVGKRFYQRHDVHILDYYLINNSGPGAGVEAIDVGVGLLHLAATRNVPEGVGTPADDGPAQTNSDVRLSDVKLGDAGKLETIVIYGSAGKRGHGTGETEWEAISGSQVNFVHTIDVLGGSNRVTLQYGQGIFGAGAVGAHQTPTNLLSEYGGGGTQDIVKGDAPTLDARKKSSTTRVTEELTTQSGKSLATSFVALYQDAKFGGLKDAQATKVPDKVETTAGVRPVYNFTDTTALALEYGFTGVKNAYTDGKAYKNASLHKITLAPQVTAGPGFWARPQLRLFATYASWDADSKGQIGGPVYAGDRSGFSTGAQLEAWW